MSNSILREVQLIQLNMLLKVDEICRLNNIRYYLIGGSALGAVRHKGFIPWDDDVDIGMFRRDYDQFLDIADKFLDNKYFLQTNRTDPDYHGPYAKLRANNTTYIEKVSRSLGAKIHQGIFIDIFPLDNVPDKKLLLKLQLTLMRFLLSVAFARVNDYPVNRYKRYIKKVYSIPFLKLIKKRTFDEIIDKIASFYKDKETDRIANLFGRYGEKEVLPKYYFGEAKYLEFEGHKLPVPEYYDEFLKHIYGDYMKLPPVEKRGSHDIEYIDIENSYEKYFIEEKVSSL
ncbi:MAG TPA: LicD family protein [Thermoanaerobacterales bacterium]|nr:LicD family protein [Thermoanaerobacterales bacterium]